MSLNNFDTWLARLEEIERKATSPVWMFLYFERLMLADKENTHSTESDESIVADAEFIAESRNALPKLLAVIRIYREALEETKRDSYGINDWLYRVAKTALAQAEELVK